MKGISGNMVALCLSCSLSRVLSSSQAQAVLWANDLLFQPSVILKELSKCKLPFTMQLMAFLDGLPGIGLATSALI
jgi:hypothetical protein